MIPTFNELSEIQRCLDAVATARAEFAKSGGDQHIHVDTIVTDGGSFDGTKQVVRKNASDATLLLPVLGQAKTRAGVLDRAVRYIETESGSPPSQHHIIFFLHVDCRIPPTFFNTVVKFWWGVDSQCFRDNTVEHRIAMTRNRSSPRVAFCRLVFDDPGWLYRFYALTFSFDSPVSSFGDQVGVCNLTYFVQLFVFGPSAHGRWPDSTVDVKNHRLNEPHLVACS